VSAGREALDRAVAAWNAGDYDAYLSFYAEDAVLHGYPDGATGREGARTTYAPHWIAFPHSTIELDEVIEVQDFLAARFVYAGVHEGPLGPHAPTGRSLRLVGRTLMRFADGVCVERWAGPAEPDLFRQLGL
jgi:predicted ester cyclase